MSVVDAFLPSPPATSSRKQSLPFPTSKPLTSTPNDSPASGPECSSLGSRRKVEFSPWTNVHQPDAVVTSSLLPTHVKTLPPSRECSTSGKSILKPTGYEEAVMSGLDGTSDEHQSLSETMDSIVQQLARNDDAESVDAYNTLASAIKAYDELPEEVVIKTKLLAITKHIRRHLSIPKKTELEPIESRLVTSALKLAIILVWNQEFSSLLSDDFRIFLLDKSISVLAEHSAPKAIIVHYLHLLATQDFRPALLSSNSRGPRLLDALKSLTDHIQGNSIASQRVLVYQRLLDQARPAMKSKASSWVEEMLSAMVSLFPDTRNKALALGRKACQAFPVSASICTSMRMALDLKQESGRTLGMTVCRKLEKLVISKDDAAQVPQIWAIIMLLCNSPSHKIDAWRSMKDWLMVIQRCFNASDSALRQQAHLAWNRFVYVARPAQASDSLFSMLVKPIVAQIERQSTDKSSKATHSGAVSGYCNLLYYAFRPSGSTSTYTRAWNEYVVKVMRSSFFERNPANADVAARCLTSLLWHGNATTKLWQENRAHDNRAVEPEELPTVDAKWIRSKSQNVLLIFQLLFRHSSWGLPGASQQAHVSKAWKHFLKAVHEAGSKEIKMSNESSAAIETTLSFVSTLWADSVKEDQQKDTRKTYMTTDVLLAITRSALYELGVARVADVLEMSPSQMHPMVLATVVDRLKESIMQTPSIMQTQSSGLLPAPYKKMAVALSKSLANTYLQQQEANSASVWLVVDSISHALSVLPEAYVESFLSDLGPGLSLWVRDDNGLLSSPSSTEEAQFWGSLPRFARTLTSTLQKVTPHAVEKLDIAFAAAFASTHKTIVNAMVPAWNLSFGTAQDLKLGTELGKALDRLRPYVEIDLPVDPHVPCLGPAYESIPAYETQDPVERRPWSSPQTSEVPVKAASEQRVAGAATSLEQGAARSKVASKQNESRPRSSPLKRRYEDSQIEFVPVASSPPAEMEDSQMLTDHQKEVRDHRRQEPAVVFADLRSSPRPSSRRSKTPDCGIARRAAASVERPTTPTLADQLDSDALDQQASPTPKSKNTRNFQEVEIPSSPPSAAARRIEDDGQSSPVSQHVPACDRDVDFEIVQTVPNEVEAMVEEADGNKRSDEGHDTDAKPEQQLSAEDTRCSPETHVAVFQESIELTNHPELSDQITTVHDAARTPDDEPEADDDDLYALPSHGPHELEDSVPANALFRVTAPQPNTHTSDLFNSDELEEMTAEQLSQDLNWANVFEGLDKTPDISPQKQQTETSSQPHATIPDQMMADAVTRAQEEDRLAGEEASFEVIAVRKRTRGSNGYADQDGRRKRRRTTSRSNSTQSDNTQSRLVKKEEELEVTMDCIEVDTSSEDAAGPSSPVLQHDHEVTGLRATVPEKRRVGRPRKQLSQVTDQEPGMVVSSSRGSTHSTSRSRSQRIPTAAVELMKLLNEPPSLPSEVPESATSSVDIETSLQNMLQRLKTARHGDFHLRNVDDLLFQIRCEVHAAAERDT